MHDSSIDIQRFPFNPLLDSEEAAVRRPLWRPEELGAILRHQLDCSIVLELELRHPEQISRLKFLCAGDSMTFRMLFERPAPSLELLQMVKSFAKGHRRDPHSPLPGEVASVLYYATIASALVHGGHRISRLDERQLATGFAWVNACRWVDQPLRCLMELAMEQVFGSGQS